MCIYIVTRPPLESYLNCVPDPMPPPARRLADLTSPAPSENTPPKDVSRKLPRRLWPRRHRGKHPAFSANQNSAPRVVDPATPLGPSANEYSARAGSSSATRPRSTANGNSPFPGHRPGTSRSPKNSSVKHPQTFQHSQHPQHPRSTANENRERRFRLDHPEIRWVYKLAQHCIRQDTQANRHRDNFSGSGFSSPALQQPTHRSFSGLPAGPVSLTDPKREARDAGGYRPGLIFQLPCAAHPDTRLVIDAAHPESTALSRAERPPTVLDIPETRQAGETSYPGPSQQRGSLLPRHQSCKRPRNRSSGVYQPKKCSPHRGHWCE